MSPENSFATSSHKNAANACAHPARMQQCPRAFSILTGSQSKGDGPRTKLTVTSDDLTKSFELVYDAKEVVVRRNSAWEIFSENAHPFRLGMPTLHWTSALRRAIDEIEVSK